MRIHIVYCHPSQDSLTYSARQEFIRGLEAAGHSWTLSDLYAMGFDPNLSEAEYRREAFYDAAVPVPPDVAEEQSRLLAADGVAFIFPLFWMDAPARLKGWFDRVWTYGFAYGPQTAESGGALRLKKALYLVSAGNTLRQLRESGKLAALETNLLVDRIWDRAREKSLVILDGTSRELDSRLERWEELLRAAFEAGKGFGGESTSCRP